MFYFAWVANGGTTFGVEHHVEDEKVVAFSVAQQESEFASASIDVRNPRVGLLSEDREHWMWLGWRKPDNSVVPLFHGRLVGIPDGIEAEFIRLTFLAQPEDFIDQKEAVAATLRVDPFWDPVWIAPEALDDPDTVLEARPQLWHIGRTDKTVTASDIVNGEAGTIVLDGDDVIADSLDINIGNDPVRRVSIEATVNWSQFATGNVDLRTKLLAAFAAAGSSSGVTSFTGQGLESSWPLPLDGIGGGWSVQASSVQLLSGDAVTATFVSVPIVKAVDDVVNETTGGPNAARFYLWEFWPTFVVTYEASRARTEVLTFDLFGDSQSVITDSDPSKALSVKIGSSAVAAEVDGLDGTFAATIAAGLTSGLEMPIGDLRRKSYFNTDRGKRSLRWLIALARTKLMYSARSVEVQCDIPFELATTFSCRHNATIIDPHLPGGQATGKVTGYSFSADGDKGELSGHVVIACSIGRGNALSIDAGDPTYCEDDYATDYQFYLNANLDLGTGDVSYEDFHIDVDDDGTDFFDMSPSRVVESFEVFNGETVQRAALDNSFIDVNEAINALNAVFTRVELTMKPVTAGPFSTRFPVVVSDLMLAKTIDLEAAEVSA